jgi:hypothetical protein
VVDSGEMDLVRLIGLAAVVALLGACSDEFVPPPPGGSGGTGGTGGSGASAGTGGGGSGSGGTAGVSGTGGTAHDPTQLESAFDFDRLEAGVAGDAAL